MWFFLKFWYVLFSSLPDVCLHWSSLYIVILHASFISLLICFHFTTDNLFFLITNVLIYDIVIVDYWFVFYMLWYLFWFNSNVPIWLLYFIGFVYSNLCSDLWYCYPWSFTYSDLSWYLFDSIQMFLVFMLMYANIPFCRLFLILL